MSRESSYSAAGRACSQVEAAADEIQSAVNSLNARVDTIAFYWKGESGTAMNEGLTALIERAAALAKRANQLSSQMRASQRYDYSLWPEEES